METPEARAKAAELHQRRIEEENLKNPLAEGDEEEEEDDDDEEGEVDENEEFSSGEEEINVCFHYYLIVSFFHLIIHSHYTLCCNSITAVRAGIRR